VNHPIRNRQKLRADIHVINSDLIEGLLAELDRRRFAFNEHPRLSAAIMNNNVRTFLKRIKRKSALYFKE